MTKTTLLWISSASLAAGGLGAWRYFNPPLPPAHVAVLDDRSDSMPHDCGAIVAMGQRALKLPHIGSKSTFSLFATTDEEPSFVASFKLPTARLTTESKRRQVEAEKAFFDALHAKCAELAVWQVSPVLHSIQQVVDHLKAVNPSSSAVHYVLARTDLQETADKPLQKLLQEPPGSDIPKEATRIIDNVGIRVIVCGYAESIPQRASKRAFNIDRTREVWPTLFTHPDLVRLEPFCPKPEIVAEAR